MTTPVVLVTGALTGIGRATALAFAREGARIVISGRHDDEGQKLAAQLQKLGAEAEFLRSDVRREDDVRNLIDKTVSRFGRLDAAVNCAGTEGARIRPATGSIFERRTNSDCTLHRTLRPSRSSRQNSSPLRLHREWASLEWISTDH